VVAEDLEVVELEGGAVEDKLPEAGLAVLTPRSVEAPELKGLELGEDAELITPVAEMVLAVGVTAVHDELDELATETGAEYCRLPTESRIWKVM